MLPGDWEFDKVEFHSPPVPGTLLVFRDEAPDRGTNVSAWFPDAFGASAA